MPPFKRLFVANRGEIAVRIVRACEHLGIESVAAVSDADRDTLAARLATYPVAPRAVILRMGRPEPSLVEMFESIGHDLVHSHSRLIRDPFDWAQKNVSYRVGHGQPRDLG